MFLRGKKTSSWRAVKSSLGYTRDYNKDEALSHKVWDTYGYLISRDYRQWKNS